MSASMLSDTFIHSLLTRSFAPSIRTRYLNALDVHSRVTTDSMTVMLRQLAGLERTYRTLGRSVSRLDLSYR